MRRRRRRLDHIQAMVPFSCVSAQGGPPTAGIQLWAPPYRFSLGSAGYRTLNCHGTATFTATPRR